MCAEIVGPKTLFRGAPCGHCGATFEYAGVAEARERAGMRRLWLVCGLVAAAHLIVGWLPLLDTIVLLLAAIWLRFGIISPATSLMSARRRVVARLTSRMMVALLLAATLVASQLLTLLAAVGVVLKAIIGAAQVAGAAWLITRYTHWQLRREAAGKDVAGWEWALPLGMLALIAGIVIGLVAALAFVFETLDNLLSTGAWF